MYFFVILWKAVESNICNFGIFDWVFFLFLAVRTVVGKTVMFRLFHAKSLEIAKQDSERLFDFSPHEPRIYVHGPTRPMAAGEYEYRLFIVPKLKQE